MKLNWLVFQDMVQGEGERGGSVAFHGVEDPDMAHFLKNTFLKW